MKHEEQEDWVREHQAELYRYVRYLGAESPALAEDLVQETFLEALQSRSDPLQAAPAARAAWLRGIARNRFLMHCRRQRANPVKADQESVRRAEAVWTEEYLAWNGEAERVAALRACLGLLPEKKRVLLRMQYEERRSRAQMAAESGLSEESVKSALRRIRSELAECLRRRLEHHVG